MTKKTVCLTAPVAWALSGVSTHLRQLLGSDLAARYRLVHYQVGREGREESRVERIGRLTLGPASFSRFLRRERVDLVHLNSSMDRKAFFRDMSLALAARSVGARVIFQVHGGDLPSDFLGALGALRPAARTFCRLPHAWVFLYEAERGSLLALFPRTHAEVIPNGVDARAYDGPRAPRGEGPIVFGYLGRLAETKGMGDAIEALALLREHGRLPQVVFRIAGDGPDRERLGGLARERGLGDVVEFPGPLHDEAKIAFLKGLDVLLFPTYHIEGLPYTLLEAMAAGAAVITTRVAGMVDVLGEGKNALFVSARDPSAIAGAIARLAGDGELRRRMGEANAARIREHYTAEIVARRFAGLYERVLGGR